MSAARLAEAGSIRVMVCDDSVVIRAALTRMLESEPGILVVSRVANGQLALDAMRRQPVDVVLLDVEMPVMDGLEALPLLLRADPGLRVIMASTLTTRGADIALRALRMGAADYVPKPSSQSLLAGTEFRDDLVAKVRGLGRLRNGAAAQPTAAAAAADRIALRPAGQAPALLAVGSSTGGPQALFTFVQGLAPPGLPPLPVPVVVTQHMPATFTAILANHLMRLGAMPCAEARDGEALQAGRLYLAPGDRHLLVQRGAGGLAAKLSDGPAENYCRPAVDPMLRSATQACDGRVLAVMLTGMGQDGLAGTRTLIEARGTALAQDEATSVVWGMPGAIARHGLCHGVLPIGAIAPKVRELVRAGRR